MSQTNRRLLQLLIRLAEEESLIQILEQKTELEALKHIKEIQESVADDSDPDLQELEDEREMRRLIQALEDPSRDSRMDAAETLGRYKNAAAVDALIKALHDTDGYVRSEAALALGKIGDDKAVEELFSTLEFGLDGLGREVPTDPRSSAAEALGLMKAKNTVERLIGLLAQGDLLICSYVADVLGEFRDDRAVVPLIKLVKEGNSPVATACAKAALALGKLGDKSAVPVLLQALQYEDGEACSAAKVALGNIRDPSAVGPIIQSVQRGLNSYAGSDHAGIMALGELGDAKAIEFLISILGDKSLDTSYFNPREDAALALGTTKNPAVIEPLLNSLSDKDAGVRARSATALGEMVDLRVVKPLIQAAKDDDWRVRNESLQSLGRLSSSLESKE